MWHVNYQHLINVLKLTKNIFKIFTSRILKIHPLYKLFWYKICYTLTFYFLKNEPTYLTLIIIKPVLFDNRE